MRVEQGSSVVDQMATPVADQNEGSTVLQEVVRMTGLPESYLDSALSGLLGKPEASVNDMTLNELRSLLLECLDSLNAEMSLSEESSMIPTDSIDPAAPLS